MKTKDYATSFTVDQSPEEVFDAINNVRGWWSEEIDGSTDKLRAEFKFRYKDFHRGTDVVFEITKKGDKTELRFTHVGLIPVFECHGDCSGAWSFYINDSLRSLIKTGKGQPNPKE
jgi:hypothetical protein